MTESSRRENSESKVLALFQAQQIATNIELNQICYRYGARIHALRAKGYDIVTGEKRGGVVVYRFNGLKQTGQQELFA
jgi:hypothetical protein